MSEKGRFLKSNQVWRSADPFDSILVVSHVSPAAPFTFTSRPQIALNLGTLIADGYLAVEAQDKQEVRNISREIKSLAKTLGLEHDLVIRSNSIGDFADARQWSDSHRASARRDPEVGRVETRADRGLTGIRQAPRR